MKVRVRDRLAGGHSHIDAEVVAVGMVVSLDSPLNRLDKCPHRMLLPGDHREKIWGMPAWNDERMAWGEREGVGECVASLFSARSSPATIRAQNKHGSIITT